MSTQEETPKFTYTFDELKMGAPAAQDVVFMTSQEEKHQLTEGILGYLAMSDEPTVIRAGRNVAELYSASALHRHMFGYQDVDVFGTAAVEALKLIKDEGSESLINLIERNRRIVASQQGHRNPLPLRRNN